MASKIRLGIDLDGVICLNMRSWANHMNPNVPSCHTTLLEGDRHPTWDSPFKVCPTCFGAAINDPKVIMDYDLEPFAKIAIDMMFRVGVKMVVITSRPDPVRYATVNYLKEVGLLPYFEAVRFADNKLPVAIEEKLNFMLDDRPKNLDEFIGSPIVPIVFDQPYNQEVKALRAKGWLDVAEIILQNI